MTESVSEEFEEKKLPRRDWILLPLLSLVTIIFLTTFSEFIARRVFTYTSTYGETYMVINSSSQSMGGVPNSVIWAKIPEGELTEYRLNSSGYRSNTDFGPKPPGTYRIVAIGSSLVLGLHVPIEKVFATTLSPELSQLTGKKVETINLGMAGSAGTPPVINLRFKDALAAQPDMILRVVTPWDIQHELSRASTNDGNTTPTTRESLLTKVIGKVHGHLSHAAFLLQHYLYQSQSQYVNTYLINGDTTYNSGFLSDDLNEEWKKQLNQFDKDDAAVQERVKAAGVPMVTVFVPLRAQAAMISMGEWPAGYNPYRLDDELHRIVTSHGGTYIDILPDIQNIPNPEQGYHPLEGHLNAHGHAMISRLLAKELTNGAVPALNATNP
jgi:hypothetical protein